MTTKSLFYPLWAVCSLLALNACDDTLDNLGSDVIGSEFVVGADTLYMQPFQLESAPMYYNQDTLLLGEYFDSQYGTIQAEVLAEVLPIRNDTILPTVKTTEGKDEDGTKNEISWTNPTFDSLVLVANSQLLNGSYKSPVKINIYEKTKTLTESGKDYTDIDVDDYYDRLLAESWLTGNGVFRVKLLDDLGRYLFGLPTSLYKAGSEEAFREAFKGLYFTTSGGKDFLFDLSRKITDTSTNTTVVHYFDLRLFYHYENYTMTNATATPPASPKKDSIFYSTYYNPLYPRAQRITNTIDPSKLNVKDNNRYSYVTSPAGLRSSITIDLPRIKQRLGMNDRDININKAVLSLQAKPDEDTTLPMPKYLMLIQKKSLENFFKEGKNSDGRTSFVATRDEATNQYAFDIAPYIQKKKNDGQMDDLDTLVVVPVSYGSSYFKEKIGLSALRFYRDSVQVDIIYNHLKTKD